MVDLEKTLYDLCLPLTDNEASLSVKQLPTPEDSEVLLCVYAGNKDIARLIGRKGVIASALRQMLTVAGRDLHKRISVKFESY